MSYFMGIDPGNNGAMAILDPDVGRMMLFDMPTFEYQTTRNRVKVDAYSVADIVKLQPLSMAVIEEVHSSPQMGVVSAFSFGRGSGVLEGIMAALGIPLTYTKPTQWKKAMRVPADKRAAVQRACQLFPALAAQFKGPRGGVIDGRAEAAILALYGAMEAGRTPTSSVQLWED